MASKRDRLVEPVREQDGGLVSQGREVQGRHEGRRALPRLRRRPADRRQVRAAQATPRRPRRRRRARGPRPGRSAAASGTPSWGKPGVAPPAPTGSPTAGSTASAAQLLRKNATGTGNRLNTAQNNPRRGQRFNVIQRGDKTLHKYAPGRVFTGQAAGPGSVRYRKPKRKPPLPAGARTSGFGSTSWSQR